MGLGLLYFYTIFSSSLPWAFFFILQYFTSSVMIEPLFLSTPASTMVGSEVSCKNWESAFRFTLYTRKIFAWLYSHLLSDAKRIFSTSILELMTYMYTGKVISHDFHMNFTWFSPKLSKYTYGRIHVKFRCIGLRDIFTGSSYEFHLKVDSHEFQVNKCTCVKPLNCILLFV